MAEFFTSYARADDSNRLLKKFVAAVEDKVRGLCGLPVDQRIAFFDVRDIKTGNEWRDILAEPLRVAKVFVCLISPTYVTRPVCSKEFSAFVERYERWKRDELAAWQNAHPQELNPPSFIVTLEWEKFILKKPPAAVTRFQTSDDAFPEDYRKYGLRDFLMFKKPQTKAYVDLVKAVATLIATAMDAVPAVPPADNRPDFDGTANLFQVPAAPPQRLADAIAVAPAAGPAGRVEHPTIEAEARALGVQFEVAPILVTQVENVP
jgi:hypothetical protein